jgi:hypothetical protein
MAEYNGKAQDDIAKARTRLDWLIEHEKRFSITQIRKKRTNTMNSWVHGAISEFMRYFVADTGNDWTYEEVKNYIKRHCCPRYEKDGVTFVKGTSKLDVKEFSEFMDRLYIWSQTEHGILLSTPDEYKRGLNAQETYNT